MVSVERNSHGQEAMTNEGVEISGEQRISSLQEVEGILTALCRELATAGYSEKDVFGVRLSLDEAIVNAIKHGNQCDPAKTVCVRYRITPESLWAEVEDQGEGFDPAQVPNPLAAENLERCCGRGVFLMRAYMTWVRYNERGNCVTLCKYRSAA